MPDQQKYTNKLKAKRVVIIGGTSGMGYGLAEAILEKGGYVVVTGSRDASVEKTLARLKESYPSAAARAEGYALSLADEATQEDNVRVFFEKVGQKGKIDHIVFTAGDPVRIGHISEMALADIKQAGMVSRVSVHMKKSTRRLLNFA
jgi:NAD(P)-dependent dehydrogenase (short-subunit alcohol dehydrogenase family)